MRSYLIQGYDGIDTLASVERLDPTPGPRQALVRLRAASLNYRDLLMVKGAYSRSLPLPLVPLSDGAGEVVAVGALVRRWKVGDRVMGCFMEGWVEGRPSVARARTALGGAVDGVLCELRAFDEDGLVALPAHLTFEEGATLPCAGVTAWSCLAAADVRAGSTVLVLGTGGVSIFALQLGRLLGARVIVTSSSDEKLGRARALGASDTINYRSDPEWDRRVLELTGGEGVDCVVEVGGAGTLPRSIKALRMGGTISLVGVLTGAAGEFNPRPLVMKAARLQGVFVGSRAAFEDLCRALVLHEMRPVVDRVFSFDEARQALRWLEGASHFGKIVVRVP